MSGRTSIDAMECKLKNRRVRLYRFEPEVTEDGLLGEWVVSFVMLTKDKERRVTDLHLSDEALEALVLSYLHMKNKDTSIRTWVQKLIDSVSFIGFRIGGVERGRYFDVDEEGNHTNRLEQDK